MSFSGSSTTSIKGKCVRAYLRRENFSCDSGQNFYKPLCLIDTHYTSLQKLELYSGNKSAVGDEGQQSYARLHKMCFYGNTGLKVNLYIFLFTTNIVGTQWQRGIWLVVVYMSAVLFSSSQSNSDVDFNSCM